MHPAFDYMSHGVAPPLSAQRLGEYPYTRARIGASTRTRARAPPPLPCWPVGSLASRVGRIHAWQVTAYATVNESQVPSPNLSSPLKKRLSPATALHSQIMPPDTVAEISRWRPPSSPSAVRVRRWYKYHLL